MTSLINKIEQLIKREKSSPDRKKKDDTNKSSSEILSELFGAFNADPPKIDEYASKKSKKSKKKHKKEKKKRSRSSSSSSDDSEQSHKRKKRKKTKSKKRKRSDSPDEVTPPRVKIDPDLVSVKKERDKPKDEVSVKTEHKDVKPSISIKHEDSSTCIFDAAMIPMPQSPQENQLDENDLRFKLESKKSDQAISDTEKSKGKIQIKNLKFSTVFEETVKKAEEAARKKAEKYEEGEYSSSQSTDEHEKESNSQFPKSSDPGGILKKTAEEKLSEDEKKHKKSRHSESSRKSSRRDSSRSRKRSRSKTRRRSSSRTRHSSRSRHTSSFSHSRSHRSRSRHRSRSGHRSRHLSPRHSSYRSRRSPTGVRLADSEKKRLLEVARRNAINMLKNGAVPGSAAALPLHTRNQVMAAIQSGGKSVDELTDFCKHLSKKEALGELSSVESNEDGDSENEDTLAFHHPFLVKEKGPIVMNIRGGVPLPTKASSLPIVNKDELTKQFPVSSGTQHRDKAIEWVPVSPKKDTTTTTNNMQLAKIEKPAKKEAPKPVPSPTASAPVVQFALPGPSSANDTPVLAPFMKQFKPSEQLCTVPTLPTLVAAPPALPAPGPQAYPPGVQPPKTTLDITSLVAAKLSMIRKEQEKNELFTSKGYGFSSKDKNLGQFTGTTCANILTPKELASGTQAWAKKDQLTRAAPVAGGMGMALLQKMGWTPGQGLGKEGTGTLQPLLLEVKLDTRGLQAREEGGGRQRGAKQRLPGPGKPRGGGGPAPLVAGGKHPVSLLGEYCSKHKLGPPEYDLCFESGPDHKKHFLFKVKVNSIEYQPAVASANKKQAKADAAQLALQKLGIVT